MIGPLTADQLAEAKADFLYWSQKAALSHHVSALVGLVVPGSLTGNEYAEESFMSRAWGDRESARGLSQWHNPRRGIIKLHMGIDVWTDPPAKQRVAMFGEMTQLWSCYRHVWSELMAATTVEQAVEIEVVKYEQSGDQARDITRRTQLAYDFIDLAQREGWAGAMA